ncbi:MAG: hypothetical protein ACOYXC_12995 [Candidatus Rifleibacteriota bacterium]
MENIEGLPRTNCGFVSAEKPVSVSTEILVIRGFESDFVHKKIYSGFVFLVIDLDDCPDCCLVTAFDLINSGPLGLLAKIKSISCFYNNLVTAFKKTGIQIKEFQLVKPTQMAFLPLNSSVIRVCPQKLLVGRIIQTQMVDRCLGKVSSQNISR